MKYPYAVKIDDKIYKAGEDVPELGSIVCTQSSGKVRSYELLSADLSKLPKYDDLETGSSAYCIDTGSYYKYESTTKTWNEQ